jgi:hypothetical protein
MAPRSPAWNLFHFNGTKYRGDKTHRNAWCKGCVKKKIQERVDSDTVAIYSEGAMGVVLTEKQKIDEGEREAAQVHP